jgi:SAM-dependent methyltransferase
MARPRPGHPRLPEAHIAEVDHPHDAGDDGKGVFYDFVYSGLKLMTTSGQAIFSGKSIRRYRARSAQDFLSYNFLSRHAIISLSERLSDIKRSYDTAIINAPEPFSHDTITRAVRFYEGRAADISASDELPPFAHESADLYLSNLTLHRINDLPGTLAQINRILRPDGLFMAAMFGGETLYELRDCLMRTEIRLRSGASPRIFPFADKRQMGGLLQRAGFALPVTDSDIITVTYKDLRALLHDLRGMGESNAITDRDRRNPGKRFFQETETLYRALYPAEDGRITASFEIIYLIGWHPHSSQQKPLRPGSAEARLSDALDTDEFKGK